MIKSFSRYCKYFILGTALIPTHTTVVNDYLNYRYPRLTDHRSNPSLPPPK